MSVDKEIDYFARKIFDYFLLSNYFVPNPSRRNVYRALCSLGYAIKQNPSKKEYYSCFRKFLVEKKLLKKIKTTGVSTYKRVKPKLTTDEANEFYNSWEWKRVRYQVLQERGAKCCICGADSNSSRIVVDHIKPLRLYPELALEKSNLQVLCDDCNKGKSNF